MSELEIGPPQTLPDVRSLCEDCQKLKWDTLADVLEPDSLIKLGERTIRVAEAYDCPLCTATISRARYLFNRGSSLTADRFARATAIRFRSLWVRFDATGTARLSIEGYKVWMRKWNDVETYGRGSWDNKSLRSGGSAIFAERADAIQTFEYNPIRLSFELTSVKGLLSWVPTIGQRTLGARLDVDLVKSWIRECRSHEHSRKFDSATAQTTYHGDLRVIDCNASCLVDVDQKCEYLTLSYVWGKQDPSWLVTSKANVRSLYKRRALRTVAASTRTVIPQTISDAIQLTLHLGFQYLWVDSLCIVQDDQYEKFQLIQKMDSVYQQAYMTILSCATEGSQEPIPGVGSDRANHAFRITAGQCSFRFDQETKDLSYQLSLNPRQWGSRGWCFQEQCLSRRCLFLTAKEAFFVCETHQKREGHDYWNPQGLDRPCIALGSTVPDARSESWLAYELIEQYSAKNLTYPGDILNAFTGIYNQINKPFPDCARIQIHASKGIYLNLLPYMLLWRVDLANKTMMQHGSAKRCVTSALRLPSWTWASKNLPVDYGLASTANGLRSFVASFDFGLEGSKTSTFQPIGLFQPHLDLRSVEGVWRSFFQPAEVSSKGTAVPERAALSPGHLGFYVPCVYICDQFRFCFPKNGTGRYRFQFYGAIQGSLGYDTGYNCFFFDGDIVEPDELVFLAFHTSSNKAFVLGIRSEAGISTRVGYFNLDLNVAWLSILREDMQATFRWRYVCQN